MRGKSCASHLAQYGSAERTSSSTSSVTWSSPSWTATRTIASAAISTQNHAATRHASRCVFLSSMHLAHSPCHLSMRSSVCPIPPLPARVHGVALDVGGGCGCSSETFSRSVPSHMPPRPSPPSSRAPVSPGLTCPLSSYVAYGTCDRKDRALTLCFCPPQNFGPDIQKDIDTVKDDCFQCRAAAARRVPA